MDTELIKEIRERLTTSTIVDLAVAIMNNPEEVVEQLEIIANENLIILRSL